MYELKKMGSYLRVNLLGPGPHLLKKEFTGQRSHKGCETLVWTIYRYALLAGHSASHAGTLENVIHDSAGISD